MCRQCSPSLLPSFAYAQRSCCLRHTAQVHQVRSTSNLNCESSRRVVILCEQVKHSMSCNMFIYRPLRLNRQNETAPLLPTTTPLSPLPPPRKIIIKNLCTKTPTWSLTEGSKGLKIIIWELEKKRKENDKIALFDGGHTHGMWNGAGRITKISKPFIIILLPFHLLSPPCSSSSQVPPL